MGVDLMKLGVQLRKFVIFAIRKSVCSHPFLVAMVFGLIFLYRSFPFVFSVLVSASPVLVCTAVLLGTLLSFGQPNIPEIEKDELKSHEIVSLRTGVSRNDAIVLERNDESHTVERYAEKNRDLVSEKSFDGESTAAADNRNGEVDGDDDTLRDHGIEIKEKSLEIKFEKLVSEKAHRDLGNAGFELKSDSNEQKLGYGKSVGENDCSQIQKVDEENNLELENGRSPRSGDSFDMQRAGLLDSPLSLNWKQRVSDEGEGDHDDEEDLASESGSDGSESSSSDASMADIIPMLEELHPLLDQDTPSRPPHDSHEGYVAVSQKSPDSVGSSDESDDGDSEVQDELDAGDDEEIHGDKEDGAKEAIIWTEDDQKNLMDLGSSELERNQRLESLIARRRLRKSMKLIAEQNLIDLDSADLHFNIAPISTARKNPFDLPHDSNDNMGLPTIPGSAPSILAPRMSPFDIPYDSGEEKPDLLEDSFRQEFMTFQSKDPVFRRHESFNVGHLFFGQATQEKHGSKLRPLFVPERMDVEGMSYPLFQRQSSELSDSKVSSVPETESVSSAEDLEDKKVTEEDISQGAEMISITAHVPEHITHEISSEHSDSRVSSDTETESLPSARDPKHSSLIEEEVSQKAELISSMVHVSKLVAHGSQSSVNVDSAELSEVKNRDTKFEVIELKQGNSQSYHEQESSLYETRNVDNPLNGREAHVNAEAEHTDSNASGSSSSEVNDKTFTHREGEMSSSLEAGVVNLVEPGLSTTPLSEEPGIKIASGLVDDTHKEPVYDLSPSAVEKTLSSSVSSDFLGEMSEMGLLPVVIKRTVSFADDESELSNHGMEKDVGDNTEILPNTLQVRAVSENELVSSGFTEISERSIKKLGFSNFDQNSYTVNASMVPHIVDDHVMENDTSSAKGAFLYSELNLVGDADLGYGEIIDVSEDEVDKIDHTVIASTQPVESNHRLEKVNPSIKEILEADLSELHPIGHDNLESAGIAEIIEDNVNTFDISRVDEIADSADTLMVPGTLNANLGTEENRPFTKEILEDSSKLHSVNESELVSKEVAHVVELDEVDGIAKCVNTSSELVVHDRELESDTPTIKEILETDSVQIHTVDETNLVSTGIMERIEHDNKKFGTSGVDIIIDSADALMLLGTSDPNQGKKNDSVSNKEILEDSLELHPVCDTELGCRGVIDVTEPAEVDRTADSVNPLPEVVASNHGMGDDTTTIKEIVEAELHVIDENKIDSAGVREVNEQDAEKVGISGDENIADSASALKVSELEPNNGIDNDPRNKEILGDLLEPQVAGENESGPRAVTNVIEHAEVDKAAEIVHVSHEAVASSHEMEMDSDSIHKILAADPFQSDATVESKLDSTLLTEITEDDAKRFGTPAIGRTADKTDASMASEISESNSGTEEDTSVKYILTESSEVHTAGENELVSRGITEVSEHDVKKVEICD